MLLQRTCVALLGLLTCLFSSFEAQAQAICAEVKIEIRQRVTLERQAFDAALRITNGLSVPVEDIHVQVGISPESGQSAGGSFHVRFDRTDGAISGETSGSWQLPGVGSNGIQSVGSLHWLIIPSALAGGEFPEGRRYRVSAVITYRMAGENKVVEVTPEIITVLPQPLLALDYFLPAEVYGDDPFTEEVEPSVPFTLGVRVRNVGHGDARALAIETAQPEIRDNPQGLLIGFEIIGAAVDGADADRNLLMRFGNLPAGSTRVGRWSMLASLSGQFFDFIAGYEHADSLGGPLTSLIASDPITHLLIKDVLVTGRSDQVLDFLASDQDILRVYESSGVDTLVTDVSDDADLNPVSGGQYTLTIQPPAGGAFVYLKIASPFLNQQVGFNVSRNGLPLPSQNAWISKTRRQNGVGWDYYFNLFDSAPASSYSIQSASVPAAAELRGLIYIDANGDGIHDPGEATAPNTTVRLTGSAGPDASPVLHEINTNNAGRYVFSDLAAGTYALEVADIPDHINGQHSVGSAGGTAAGAAITGIVIGAEQAASGYLFAKRFDPQSTLRRANLSLAHIGAPAGAVGVDEIFQVEVRMTNLGPDGADSVRVNLTVPPLLQVMGGVPTAGTFNPIDRSWVVAGLPHNAQQTLVLSLKGAEAGEFVLRSLIAHASAGVVDPTTANNQATTVIEIERPDQLQLDADVVELPRVLAFVGCSSVSPTGDCLVQPNLAHWQQMLDALGPSESLITTDPDEFLLELREGWANIVWLTDFRTSAYPQALATEIAMAILQGDGLIVDGGIPGEDVHPLQGVLSRYSLENTSPVTIIPQPLLPTLPPLTTGMTVSCVETEVASILAIYDLRPCPAIIENSYGEGKAVTAGFRFTGIASQVARVELFRALIGRVLRQPRIANGPMEHVNVEASVSNGNRETPFSLAMESDADTLFRRGLPTPSTLAPSRIEWLDDFIANEESTYYATLALGRGEPDGAEQMLVRLQETGEPAVRLVPLEFLVITVEELIQEARVRLSALQLINQGDRDQRDAILADLDSTSSHYAESEYEEAIGLLVSRFGFEFVASPEDEITALIRKRIAQAYKAIARIQSPLLPTCDASGADPQAVSSVGFRPVPYPNSGVEFRVGSSDSWAVGLGTAINQHGSFEAVNPPWLIGNYYGWEFELNGIDASIIFNRYCDPTAMCEIITDPIAISYSSREWEAPDALLFEVLSSATALDQSIKLTADEVNRVPLSLDPLVAGNGVTERNRIVVSLRRHGSTEPVYASGIARIDYPHQLPSANALRARIVPGILRCRQP